MTTETVCENWVVAWLLSVRMQLSTKYHVLSTGIHYLRVRPKVHVQV